MQQNLNEKVMANVKEYRIKKFIAWICLFLFLFYSFRESKNPQHQTSKNKMSIILRYTLHSDITNKMLQMQFHGNVKHFTFIALKSICTCFEIEAILYCRMVEKKIERNKSMRLFSFFFFHSNRKSW